MLVLYPLTVKCYTLIYKYAIAERALQGGLLMAKSGRLELGDNSLRIV